MSTWMLSLEGSAWDEEEEEEEMDEVEEEAEEEKHQYYNHVPGKQLPPGGRTQANDAAICPLQRAPRDAPIKFQVLFLVLIRPRRCRRCGRTTRQRDNPRRAGRGVGARGGLRAAGRKQAPGQGSDARGGDLKRAPHGYTDEHQWRDHGLMSRMLLCLRVRGWGGGPFEDALKQQGMSRHDAEQLLQEDGDFLVRESMTSRGQYVLTGLQQQHGKHLLLVDPHGVVRTKDRRFDSVSHLIGYHRDNQLPIISAGSELSLKQPVERQT
ncbi:unnamed protein product [Lampetra fluviatilis]